jgi:serine/threonine-protein kinase RsbW
VKRLRLPAALDSLDEVVTFVGELARSAGLSGTKARRLRLAVEEFVTNIVIHGHDGGAIYGEVEIVGGIEPERVWLMLLDRGPPFDPNTIGRPADLDKPLAQRRTGGLGLFLARNAADQITYEHSGGRNRTTIVINRG